MATTVSQTTSNSMADTLNTAIGTSHELRFYTAANALLATCTYAASSGGLSTVGGKEVITFTHGNYTDDASPTAGTVSYATIHQGVNEIVRFSDPVNDIGLSSTTISSPGTVDVNANIVIEMPAHTA